MSEKKNGNKRIRICTNIFVKALFPSRHLNRIHQTTQLDQVLLLET